MTAPRLLRVGEVASLLACSKVAVYRQAERGALPGYKVPGVGWRFDRDELQRWIEGQRRGPEGAPDGRRHG